MSAKSRIFGLPDAVINRAISKGVHPDCMLQRGGPNTSCAECKAIVIDAVDILYANIEKSYDRMSAMARDVAADQALE